MKENWIVNHLAARAHYEMPKALQMEGRLKYLITDVWFGKRVRGKNVPFNTLNKLLQRGNPAIPDNKVKPFNTSALIFELKARMQKKADWDLILLRNHWYQDKVGRMLTDLAISSDDVFYSFAYTALRPFQKLKPGVLKMIYQMDPGLLEEKIVAEEYRNAGIRNTSWNPAPPSYWKDWRKELGMSDKIVVNSEWSRQALMTEGVSSEKIRIVPLPYTIPEEAINFKRIYPDKFSFRRPLKVLFLGTLTVRKGFHRLLEAAELLKNEAVDFCVVGQKEFDFDPPKNIKLFGHVSRQDTIRFYKDSDLFLFPTLSDGFGMTQLEALSWKLPVISSSFCAEVVQNKVSGEILKENTAEEIGEVIRGFVKNPEMLLKYSLNGLNRAKEFNHERFSEQLLAEGI